MKIINADDSLPEVEHTCEHCNTVYAFNKYDIVEDTLIGKVVDCPVCGVSHEITVSELNILGGYTFKYPDDFFGGSSTESITDEQINKWISDAIQTMKDDPEETFVYFMSGDAFVAVFREVDEFMAIVTRNFEEGYIATDTI